MKAHGSAPTHAAASLSVSALTAEVAALLAEQRAEPAAELCGQLAAHAADDPTLLRWLSHAYQQLGDFDAMCSVALSAAALAPRDIAHQRRLVECHVYNGRIDLARSHLQALEHRHAGDAAALFGIAELHVHCESHADAYRCCQRAVALGAADAPGLYALAAAALSQGQLDEAEALFTRVIELDPSDADAQVNRSSLRTWSASRNHVDELQALQRRLPHDHPAQAAAGYALAKELEDLGDHALSFSSLRLGADARRARLSYCVEHDVQLMAWLQHSFDAACLARPVQHATPAAEESSVFVLGLPRSGTSLVDRILGAHSQVTSLGEINTLAFSMLRGTGSLGDKRSLVRRAASLDFAALGARYRSGARSYGSTAPRLVDKTPANFLYLGLIHLALPAARVLHLRRHPLDSCYAMYKTLFRMGYPFSYSLDDLGHYYLAYHRLMQHWRAHLTAGFIDVDYEALVNHQEVQTRRLLSYCRLPWEPACLHFHDSAAPSATASAAQVRRPLYRSSVARWQCYEKQLEPLADFLQRNGVDCS